ncbi:hypothetical protein niasHS_010923 [Heterodera schachtii]|uniref:Phospholipid/glycerol acyltransferase domain-containing protein n=1 Tax=Heterodera schachtii TaxID=97005 RepID=A0ABD2IUW9_HETSC
MCRTDLLVYIEKDDEKTAESFFKVTNRPSTSEEDVKHVHWRKALPWAQNSLICREILARLVSESVSQHDLITLTAENSIVLSMFDSLLLKVEARFHPFGESRTTHSDGVPYLSQCLRQLFLAEHAKKPKRVQHFVTLPLVSHSEELDMRGPTALSAEEINARAVGPSSPSDVQSSDLLIRKFTQCASHYVLISRTVQFLENHMVKFNDPQFNWKWIRVTPIFSMIALTFVNRGYENLGKFTTLIRISDSSITLVTKEAQQIECRRDMEMVENALLLMAAHFLLNSSQVLSRAYGWQLFHANSNAFDSTGNFAPTFYTCNQNGTKRVFVQFRTDGSPHSIFIKDHRKNPLQIFVPGKLDGVMDLQKAPPNGEAKGGKHHKPPGSRSKWSQATSVERIIWISAIPFRMLLCLINITVFFVAYFGFMLPVLWAKPLWPRFYWFYEGKLYMWLQAFIAYWGYTADYDVYEYGEDIRKYGEKDRVLVIVNHQSTADVPTLFTVLQTKGVATRKTIWLMDVMFRWTPFGIIGRMHGDYFIQQGKATRDKELIRLKGHLQKVFWDRDRRWVILFPEGGFYYKRKETSQKYAKENNFPHLEHCTLPRMGAIKAVLEEIGPRQDEEQNGLARSASTSSKIKLIKDTVGAIREKKYVKDTRPPIKYVLDVTIAYPNGQPLSIGTLCFGTREQCDIAVHYRMFDAEQVPFRNDIALRDWLYNLYAEKDKLLDNYYKNGEFTPGDEGTRIVFNWWRIVGQWAFWTISFLLQVKFLFWTVRFASSYFFGFLCVLWTVCRITKTKLLFLVPNV